MTWPVNTTEVVRTSKTKFQEASSFGNDRVFWEWFGGGFLEESLGTLSCHKSFSGLYFNSPILSVWFQYHQPSEIPAPYSPTTEKHEIEMMLEHVGMFFVEVLLQSVDFRTFWVS